MNPRKKNFNSPIFYDFFGATAILLVLIYSCNSICLSEPVAGKVTVTTVEKHEIPKYETPANGNTAKNEKPLKSPANEDNTTNQTNTFYTIQFDFTSDYPPKDTKTILDLKNQKILVNTAKLKSLSVETGKKYTVVYTYSKCNPHFEVEDWIPLN